jgi:uncharacterized protein with PIN domain
MVVANFRFYEELNDFLPAPDRKCVFASVCASGATVKQAIEALGVPHTKVEVILANGESVDFSYVVQEGDRISVYPVFESLDVTPVLKVRGNPPRCMQFIADAQLGGLAKYLRVLGFDTLYDSDYTDAQVAGIAAEDRRIVLTRNGALLMHEQISHGCLVRETRPRKQLEEMVARLDLYRTTKPFSRCPRCNRALRSVAREIMRDWLPPPVSVSGFATSATGSTVRVRIGVGWSRSSAISWGEAVAAAREVAPPLPRRRKRCVTRYAR